MNDRELDEGVESGGSPSDQTPALPARRDPDLRALVRAYPLSLRHLEAMMAERSISVDHSIGASLGHQAVAGAGEGVSPPQAPGWQELADGRDVHSRQGGSGGISAGPSTRTATRLTFCCAPIGTSLRPGVTLKNRLPTTV
ncbi:hypothetical protein BN2475_860029 [Paraburkholderia ribeironis]|uniref:Uncharacterized protein n=1 Tax=Paraburkholderia ribeironis TaxID=1247936 RepID=A0A1N7SKM3_9BURK|nr:hypothetical protein BN2475_860029 [Paraburkholderia ribeironis]